ncbi:hypothetical protein GGU45_004017 [Niabella hirudinis]
MLFLVGEDIDRGEGEAVLNEPLFLCACFRAPGGGD